MDCPTCQHRNSPAANFCEHCGTALAGATALDADAPPLGTSDNLAPTKPLESPMTAPATATAPTPATAVDPESPPPDAAADFRWQEAGAAGPLPAPSRSTARPNSDPGPRPESGQDHAANWIDLRRPSPAGPGWAAPPPAWSPATANEESRRWAMGAHISAIAGGFLGGIPAFLGPLVVWLMRRDIDGFAAGHGRNALNFNLSMLAYAFALIVFSVLTFGLGAVVAAPLGGILGIGWLVFSIVGAVRAAHDEPFRYPLTIPFIR